MRRQGEIETATRSRRNEVSGTTSAAAPELAPVDPELDLQKRLMELDVNPGGDI